jgi:hypothetical protein
LPPVGKVRESNNNYRFNNRAIHEFTLAWNICDAIQHLRITVLPFCARGTAILVWAYRAIPTVKPTGEWTSDPRYEHAQVAIAGGSFDQIESYMDINQLFHVIDPFDDGELVGLVEFLRSNTRNTRAATTNVQPWPILPSNTNAMLQCGLTYARRASMVRPSSCDRPDRTGRNHPVEPLDTAMGGHTDTRKRENSVPAVAEYKRIAAL